MSYKKRSLIKLCIGLGVGALIGLTLDLILGFGVGLWYFPRQPYWSFEYWLILPFCWAVFGAMVNVAWDWAKGHFLLIFIAINTLLFLIYEIPNLVTRSWVYDAPFWLVLIGWLPMVIVTRLSYLLILKIFNKVWNKHNLRCEIARYIKYSFVGIGGLAIHLGLMYVLTDYARLWYMLSAVIAIICAETFNYVFNHRWSYRDIQHQNTNLKTGWVKFVLVKGITDLTHLGILYLLTDIAGLWYIFSTCITILITAVPGYILVSWLVWKRKVWQFGGQGVLSANGGRDRKLHDCLSAAEE